VENSTKISVRLDHVLVYDATIIGQDPLTDLAIIQLQLNDDTLPPERIAVLGDSDKLRPGDYTIAIGNPMGLERTITVGVISGIGRYGLPVQGTTGLVYQNFIQTDAQINPGNSGGALVNIDGEVIGINNMYAVQYAAIGFAIPINMAKKVATQLIETGAVKRGFVGIGGEDITKETQNTMKLPNSQGILINRVTPGFPAAEAGIKSGDVITSLNGEPVMTYNDFLLRIGELMPGENVTLDIISDGSQKMVTITLADRDTYLNTAELDDFPSEADTDIPGSWRGINVVNLDNPLALHYNIQDVTEGVVIISIEQGSPAYEANLQEGEVIIEIDGQGVRDVGDFEKIKKQSEISNNILIYRMRRLSDGRLVRGYVAVSSE
ncbi:PDZ domain-containing protein, partial [Candidatus Latescibacterota bacterium]